MKSLHLSYYVGLLSAAHYYGAAHHSPQELQVFLEKNRPTIHCGAVRVRGTVLVSSPEATALDLVGYPHRAGGLGNVATVLSELTEKLDPEKLAAVAATAPVSWAQRLGYLLEHLGFPKKAVSLKGYVREHARDWTALSPKAPRAPSRRDKPWKLHINVRIEAES